MPPYISLYIHALISLLWISRHGLVRSRGVCVCVYKIYINFLQIVLDCFPQRLEQFTFAPEGYDNVLFLGATWGDGLELNHSGSYAFLFVVKFENNLTRARDTISLGNRDYVMLTGPLGEHILIYDSHIYLSRSSNLLCVYVYVYPTVCWLLWHPALEEVVVWEKQKIKQLYNAIKYKLLKYTKK